MAIKRITSRSNPSAAACLKCERIPKEIGLKDNTIHKCAFCGQKHFVDIYGSRIVMTVVERPDVRRRLEQLPTEEQKKIASLKERLTEAQKEAADWKGKAGRLEKLLEQYKENSAE